MLENYKGFTKICFIHYFFFPMQCIREQRLIWWWNSLAVINASVATFTPAEVVTDQFQSRMILFNRKRLWLLLSFLLFLFIYSYMWFEIMSLHGLKYFVQTLFVQFTPPRVIIFIVGFIVIYILTFDYLAIIWG